MSKKTISLGLTIAVLALVGTGCKKEKTAEDYLRSGQDFYEQNLLGKARVQYRNALAVDSVNGDAHFGLAALAKEKEDVAARQFHLQKAVVFSPENAVAVFELGEISLLMGDLPTAQVSARTLAKLQPLSLPYYQLALAVAIAEDDWSQANLLGKQALEAFPESAELLGLLGVAAQKQGHWSQAIDALDRAIELDAQNPQYRVLRVEVNEASGDIDASIKDLKALIRFSDNTDAQIIKLAKLINDQRGRAAAIDELERYIQQYPQADALQVLLVDLVKQDNPEEAGKLLERFIKAANNPTGLLFYRVNAAFRNSNVVLARQDLTTITAMTDQTPAALAEANAMLAELAWLQGDVESADVLVKSVLVLEANHSKALLLQAKLLMREGRSADAVVYLNKILVSNGQSIDALLLLAEHYQQQGNVSLAKDFYQRIALVDPNNHTVLLFQIYEAFGKQNLADAEGLLARALHHYPNDSAFLGIRLQVAALRSNVKAARAALERLQALKIDAADLLFFEGFILQQQGDHVPAMDFFGRAVSSRGRYDKALKAMFVNAQKVQAVKAFETFLIKHTEVNANDLTAQLLLAQLMFKQNPEGAIAQLSVAVGQYPAWPEGVIALAMFKRYRGDNAAALALLAEHYKQSQNMSVGIAYARQLEQENLLADAGEVYETLLLVDASNNVVRNNYALLLVGELLSNANSRKALQLTEGFASSGNPALLDTHGVVLMAAGKFTEANYMFDKALSLADIDDIRLHYADSMHRSGKPQKAQDMLKDLMSKNKGSEALAQKIAEIRQQWDIAVKAD